MSTKSKAPRESGDRTPEDTLRRTVEDCRIIELPERREGVKQFLRKATKVANRNKVRMKVFDTGVCIFVVLPVALDEAMAGLTQLIGMADEMFLLPGRQKHQVLLLLKYCTKAVYSGESKISPPDDCD